MKKIECLIIVVAILICCNKSSAQEAGPFVDSLQRELKKTTTDSSRSLVLAELAYKYFTFPDSMFRIANRGLALANAIGFEKGVAANEYSLGAYYTNIGDYVKATGYILKALNWQKLHGGEKQQARCHLSLGAIFGESGKYNKSIAHSKKGYELFQRLNDTDGMTLTLNNLGYIYSEIHNYDSALVFLQKGFDLAIKVKSFVAAAYTVGSIGELYLKKGELKKAEYYLLESNRLNNNSDLRLLSINLIKLAKVSERSGDINVAIELANKGLRLAYDVKSPTEIITGSSALYDLYLIRQNYKEALKYYRLSIQQRDSLHSSQNQERIRELMQRFELNEKEAQIKILQHENELRQVRLQVQGEEIKKQKILLVGVAIFLFLLLALALSFQKQNALRKQTNEATFNRRVGELQMEALRAQINPHFLFNALNSINHFIIKEEIFKANSYLTKLSKLIRTILENSRSKTVSLAEEISILKMYIDIERIRLENKFDFNIEVDASLDPNVTKLPSMIIQPYVENAIWHGIAPKAGRGKLEIDFSKFENFLKVSVRDNGAGRAKTDERRNDISQKKSLGGKITEERIRIINLLDNQDSSVRIIDLKDKDGLAQGTEVLINLSLNYYKNSPN